ncbi:hypothetical protein NL676_006619 [Syzygium grande]|nr:hypothetical protein NL676_006619 [Syzygium grande]
MSTVASGLIFLAARKAIQIFPENVKKLWSKWELRYGERTWALRSASSDHFQAPKLSAPAQLLAMNLRPDEKYLHEAFYLFDMFKHLFTGVILNSDEAEYSYSIICKKSAEEAFKLVEVELSLMYDLLYTKAKIVYSIPGILLRFITFSSAVSVLIIFCIAVDKHVYSHVDVAITMLLLVGAVALEVYAGFTAVLSDWTMLLLIKLRKPFGDFLYRMTSSCRLFSLYNKRWSGSMGQLNLISYCSTNRSVKFTEDEPFGFYFMLETYWQVMRVEVSDVLKEQIFKRLKENHSRCSDSGFDPRIIKELLDERGDFALQKRNCLRELQWSTISRDFDQSLLLWHIATDLCYYSDLNEDGVSACKMSQLLSDYMLHIQVARRTALDACKLMTWMPHGKDEERELGSHHLWR